jgi:hypothetical protein
LFWTSGGGAYLGGRRHPRSVLLETLRDRRNDRQMARPGGLPDKTVALDSEGVLGPAVAAPDDQFMLVRAGDRRRTLDRRPPRARAGTAEHVPLVKPQAVAMLLPHS